MRCRCGTRPAGSVEHGSSAGIVLSSCQLSHPCSYQAFPKAIAGEVGLVTQQILDI